MNLFAQVEIGEIIWLIIVILFFIGPAVWKVLSGAQQQQQQQRRRQPPRPPAQMQGRPQAPANVDDEIGQFLRRAAQRKAEPQQPVRAEVIEDVQPVSGRVDEHVEQYLRTDEFGRRSAEMGRQVSQTDAEVKKHLQEVFDHDVSTLEKNRPQPKKPAKARPVELPDAAAAGFAAMLSNAENIRQAIVINEILTRPEDRWK